MAQVRAQQAQQAALGYQQQPMAGMPYANAGYPQAYDPYQGAQTAMNPNMYGYSQPMYDAYGNLVSTGPTATTVGYVSKDKVTLNFEPHLMQVVVSSLNRS